MKQPLSYIHPNAKIAKNVVIEPFTSIDGDVEIGEGTWIGSNVSIMDGARIGKNCNIGASQSLTERFGAYRCYQGAFKCVMTSKI